MYARHVTVHGSSDHVDEVVQSVRDNVLPILQGCSGFKGQLLLVDRDKGEAIGISLWDSEAEMTASEEKVAAARQQVADQGQAAHAPEVLFYEMPILELQ